jgi:hypothetical protein
VGQFITAEEHKMGSRPSLLRVTRGDNTETMITVVACGSLWETGYADGNYVVTVYFLALEIGWKWNQIDEDDDFCLDCS